MTAEHPTWISGLLGTEFSWSGVMRTDKLTWISRALSLTGFAIAAYPTTVYLQDVPPVCLGGSGGCVTVQHSSYAHLAGIPLPLFGLAGYTLLFISACLPGQRARTAGMVFTVFAIAASAVLTYLAAPSAMPVSSSTSSHAGRHALGRRGCAERLRARATAS
jgi:uncharacterized membrane protein